MPAGPFGKCTLFGAEPLDEQSEEHQDGRNPLNSQTMPTPVLWSLSESRCQVADGCAKNEKIRWPDIMISMPKKAERHADEQLQHPQHVSRTGRGRLP